MSFVVDRKALAGVRLDRCMYRVASVHDRLIVSILDDTWD